MNGTYSIVAESGIVVDGKAADAAVIEAMRATGVIHPSHGAVRNTFSPAVAYFPAPGRTTEELCATLDHIIETVLPTTYHYEAVNL